MDFSVAKSEKRQIYRNLVILVKSLENNPVTVDLRNEISVSGIISDVDVNMNISMIDVAMQDSDQSYKYFSQLFIPSRMIRDVIIPEDMPITQCINSLLPSKLNQPKRVKVKPKPKLTFKKKRAQLQQEETLRLIQSMRDKASSSQKES